MEQIRAHGWDLESVDYFDILYSNIPRWEGPNRMRWRMNGHGRFDVHYYYKTLRGPTDVSFPWKSLWCSKEPRRISFFIQTTWGKISTCHNLIKRTHISKLVFHVEVWWWVIVALRMICGLMFFTVFGFQWVLPGSAGDLLFGLEELFWQECFFCLEFSPSMLVMDIIEEEESLHFWLWGKLHHSIEDIFH